MPGTGQKGALDVSEAILSVTWYVIWDREPGGKQHGEIRHLFGFT